MQEKIIILDFGSQTTQLIGRRLRELNEYCEILPYNKFPEDTTGIKGVILSGSPYSVYDPSAFKVDLSTLRGKWPLLGICYGAQYIAYCGGGSVEPAVAREYGRANLETIDQDDALFKGINAGSQIWMSHGDTITQLPQGFKIIASTNDVPVAAYKIEGEDTWGVQFHPEVFHSLDGIQLLDNFLQICQCKKRLVTGVIHRKHHYKPTRTIGQRQSGTWAFRGSGFFRSRCFAEQSYWEKPYLHLR